MDDAGDVGKTDGRYRKLSLQFPNKLQVPNIGPQHWSPTKEAVAEEDEAADHRRVYFNFNL